MDALTIALAQINPLVGDIDGNVDKILTARAEAAGMGADLVVFSELVVEGYTPEDMLLKPAFQDDVAAGVDRLAHATADGPGMIVGASLRVDGRFYNAALLLDGGRVAGRVFKHELPNYGVFDEKRIFDAGPLPEPVTFRGILLGLMVCEDMWVPDAARHLADAGAGMLVVVNGSPYEVNKNDIRAGHARNRAAETGLPVLYVNQVGGQDETVFDGASFAMTPQGALARRLDAWREDVGIVALHRDGSRWVPDDGVVADYPSGLDGIYMAMVRGLGDYVAKNRFPGVVIGLSGGIDSAVTAAVAVDALGADRVRCVMMPSVYTSGESLADAADCAARMGVRYDSVPISPAVDGFAGALAPVFEGMEPDTTEENIQARARGIILMAISNKFGWMVLTTGNKSEMSVGYATLYGDMCGGYSVLKDVYKTTVFRLAAWRNQHLPDGVLGPSGEIISRSIIEKPPSAELKPDQTDQDTLPDYEHLDDILHCLIEEEMGIGAIIDRGHDAEIVRTVEHMLYVAEYKRRQAPPGVKISPRHFGRDRRYPITNGFRDAR